MSVSVVMTTYNGQKYIEEQLDSLKNQSRSIDEVLIYDDGSTDTTGALVTGYISKYKLENWHYIVNGKNKGWKRNFHEGVKAATSELVFPCDQDDIWHLDKIEKMEKIMLNNQDINVLVGKYHKFFDDVNANKEGKNTAWENAALLVDKVADKKSSEILDGSITKVPFNSSFLQLMPGCCFCIRKSFFLEIEPYWFEELGHDAFYTFFSKLTDSFAIYNAYVIEWRHHTGSTSRPRGRKKSTRLKEIDRNKKVVNLLKKYIKENHVENSKKKEMILNDAEKWCNLREKFLNERNPIVGVRLVKYGKFYERARAVLTDWLYAFMQ